MKGKKLLLLGVIALLIIILLSSLLLKKKPNSPAASSLGENKPDIEFTTTKLTQVVDKNVSWELSSDKIQMDKEKNMITFSKSKGIFYQDKQKSISLQGEKGFFDLTKKDIVMEGNVEVHSAKGEKLLAQKIRWRADIQKIVGEGNVLFQQGSTKVKGDRFVTDVGLEEVEVTGHVKVSMGGN